MLLIFLMILAFFLISFSSYHYWDEYFYLVSALQHSPANLMEWEPVLAQGIFPNGFFSAKIGFVLLLDLLVQIFGDGPRSLVGIQFIFAIMVVGFVAASYGLLRELLEVSSNILPIAGVLLFLPVSVYLGYKGLSEVPSLCFATLGCWAFLRSFRSHNGWRFPAGAFYLALAVAGLFVGILCRLSSMLFFIGLVLGLVVLQSKRFHWTQLLLRTGVVLTCLCILILDTLDRLGVTPDRLAGLIMSVTERQPGLGVKLYALGMSVQLFLPSLLLAVLPPYDRQTRLACVWLGVCALPFVIGARYVEPRYFYMALVPLALLVASGLQRLATALQLARYKTGWGFLLALVVLGNWWLFAPLMPYEIDQYHYTELMAELTPRYPEASYLTPWLSDYGFLRFAFPEQQVKLSLSTLRSGREDVFRTEAFRRWVGDDGYVDSLAALQRLPRPWIYVGWTYNPTVMQLKKRLTWVGLGPLQNLEQREGLKNHLTLSWIWSHPALTLSPVAQAGPYRAFEIRLRQAP